MDWKDTTTERSPVGNCLLPKWPETCSPLTCKTGIITPHPTQRTPVGLCKVRST